MKFLFIIPDSYRIIRPDSPFRRKVRVHYLRDWTGTEVPGHLLFQPLDAMYGASYVRGRGHDVQLIDGNLKSFSRETIIRDIKSFHPDWLVCPTGWKSLDTDIEFIKQVKEHVPDVKACLSGPNVTLSPDLVLYPDSAIDLVILGEIEGGLRGLMDGNPEDNCSYLDHKGDIKRGKRTLIEDLDGIPFPARDLICNECYTLPFAPRNPVTSMLISRGCPHSKCRFCNGNTYALGAYRCRSADNILAEIDEVVNRFKIPGINFRDQCFTGNQDLVEKICREIINRSWDITWRASTRVDCVDKDLLELMARAGCHQISFGFETDDQEVLDAIGKGITVTQARKAASWAKKAGMEISGGLMLSLPGEKPDAHLRLLKYAKQLKIDYPQFQLTCVMPGAQLHDETQPVTKSRYADDCPFILNPNTDSEKLMLRKLSTLYLRFYFRPGYIINRLKKIKSGSQLRQATITAFKILGYPFLYNK